jgi:quercetin dioxygenase-like cupin family protein
MKIDPKVLPVTQVSETVTRQRATGERLEVIIYTYQPGATFPVHQHAAEQLTVVLSGELVFHFPDTPEEIVLRPSEALLIPSNRPHGASVPANAEVTRTYNVFTPVRDTLPTG